MPGKVMTVEEAYEIVNQYGAIIDMYSPAITVGNGVPLALLRHSKQDIRNAISIVYALTQDGNILNSLASCYLDLSAFNEQFDGIPMITDLRTGTGSNAAEIVRRSKIVEVERAQLELDLDTLRSKGLELAAAAPVPKAWNMPSDAGRQHPRTRAGSIIFVLIVILAIGALAYSK